MFYIFYILLYFFNMQDPFDKSINVPMYLKAIMFKYLLLIISIIIIIIFSIQCLKNIITNILAIIVNVIYVPSPRQ